MKFFKNKKEDEEEIKTQIETEFKKNVEIENLENLKLSDHEYIFHAGTLKKDKKLYAVGGRVLNFVSLSSSFKKSRKRAMELINQLNWKNGFFRKDIGYRVIDK